MLKKLSISAVILFSAIVTLSAVLSFLGGKDAYATLLDASGLLGQDNYTESTSGLSNIKFNQPTGIFLDTNGHRLFVAERLNHRVLVFDVNATSNQLEDNVADYVLGQSDFTSGSEGVTQSKLSYPRGLSYDSQDKRLFVADMNNSRIMIYDLSGGITNGMNASYVLGQPDFTSGYEPCGTCVSRYSAKHFYWPKDIAYDVSNKRLFIADSGMGRVLTFDLSGGITNYMGATNVLGQPDFVTQGGATSRDRLWGPSGLAYDSRGILFVADTSNNRIVSFDLSGGITNGMNASYVLGQSDFTSRTSGVSQSKLSSPIGVSYNGKLMVSDTGNNRIMFFDISGGITNGMNASYVLGQSDFTSRTSGVSQSKLSSPYWISSANRSLFVADWSNNRVLSFDLGLRISAVKQGQTEDLTLNQIRAEDIANPDTIVVPDFTPLSYSGGKLLLTAPNHIEPSSWWSGTYEGCMMAGDKAGFSMFGIPYPTCGSSGVLEFKEWQKTGIAQLSPEAGDTSYDIRIESTDDQPGDVKAVYDVMGDFSIRMCVNSDPSSCHKGGKDFSAPVVLEKSAGGSQTLPFQTIIDADTETGDVVNWQVEEVSYYNSATGTETPNSASPIRNPDYDSGNPESQEYLSEGVDADGNTVNVPDYPELSSGIEFVPTSGTCTSGDGGGLSDRCIKFSTTDNVRKVRVKATVWHGDSFASAHFDLLLVPPRKLSCELKIDPTEIYSGMNTHTTNETAVLYSRQGYDSAFSPYWRIDWKNGSLSPVRSGYTITTIQSGPYDSLGNGDRPELYFTDTSGTRIEDSSDMTVQSCLVDLKVKKNANSNTYPVSPNR